MFVLHCPNSSWVEQLVELSITLTWSVLESSLCTELLCPPLGATPLDIACYNGHESCALLLINNRANVDAKRDSGKLFVLVSAEWLVCRVWRSLLIRVVRDVRMALSELVVG